MFRLVGDVGRASVPSGVSFRTSASNSAGAPTRALDRVGEKNSPALKFSEREVFLNRPRPKRIPRISSISSKYVREPTDRTDRSAATALKIVFDSRGRSGINQQNLDVDWTKARGEFEALDARADMGVVSCAPQPSHTALLASSAEEQRWHGEKKQWQAIYSPSLVRRHPTSSGESSEMFMPSETRNLQLRMGRLCRRRPAGNSPRNTGTPDSSRNGRKESSPG